MILTPLIILSFLYLVIAKIGSKRPIRGAYTDDIASYQLLVPHRVNYNGEIESFFLPQFFQHDYQAKRKKRDSTHPEMVCYNLHFNGKDHQLILWPNHGFIAPQTVAEYHYPGSDMTVKARRFRRINPALCHYVGTIKGMENSKAALSLCNGLAGYIKTTDGTFFIEPVEDFGANEMGHHLHVIYDQQKSSTPADTDNKPNDGGSRRQQRHGRRIQEATNCGTGNWQSGWEKAFQRYFSTLQHNQMMPNEQSSNVQERETRNGGGSGSGGGGKLHRYLEVLVVVDKMFLDFHKDKDYENYILTVMNMVSDYYHDGSVGNILDVTVVRIIYLDQHVSALDLSINPDATKTLNSFCKWQNEINPKDVEHPQHHDIAVLITRHDLCDTPDSKPNCGLLGLAYVASACDPSNACAINEDKGLILGVVVAHEIGHLMGCNHDTEDLSGCPAKESENFFHVMSPYVSIATSVWSSCSKTYITELLMNNLGNCLIDEPPESAYKFDEMTPGSMYDADYQCSLLFPGSTHCIVDSEKFCDKLFCRVKPKKCISDGEPPAEGTNCGANKWCMRRKCVPLGERPGAIDGGWAEWDDYGPCSRSCGGGIKISERTCTNPTPRNGGAYCIGDAKRFKVCNTRQCPCDGKSFRDIQCASFDNIPRNGRVHRWRSYFPTEKRGISDNSCVLYCINEADSFSKLAPRAKDGTPCKRGTNNMCVTGQCRKVGCDWVLDSAAINDKCGICKGDNIGCKKISATYTMGGKDCTKVVTFPKGARNIKVREKAPSENTIAISAAGNDPEFYLNADNHEEQDGEKNLGADLGLYMHPETNLEELFIAGPLKNALILYVIFYEPTNVGVDYEYYIRDNNYKPPRKAGEDCEGHHWEFDEWSKCNARCDGGEKTSEPSCISNNGNGVVSDEFCSNSPKPEAKTKVCNRQPCKVRWHTGEWGLCTGCEHEPGFQVREVWCARESPRWEEEDVITGESECATVDGIKPKIRQLCTAECPAKCQQQRISRSFSGKRSPAKMDKHFFNDFYREVDMLALDPEGLLFGILKGSSKDSPGSSGSDVEQVFIGSKPKKSQVDGTLAIDPSQLIPDEIKKGFLANLHTASKDRNKKDYDSKVRCEKYHTDLNFPNTFINVPRVVKSNTMGRVKMFAPTINYRSACTKKPIQTDRNTSSDSTITKPCHSVVIDDLDKNHLTLIEADYLPPNDNLSDVGFQKLGDKESGRTDVQRELKGDEAICAMRGKNNKAPGGAIDQSEEDVTEKEPLEEY